MTNIPEVALSGHVNHLNFGGHQPYLRKFGTVEAIVVKFSLHVDYVKSQHIDDKCPSKGAWFGSREPL